MLFQVGGQGTRPTFFEMAAAQQLPASLRAALTYSIGVNLHLSVFTTHKTPFSFPSWFLKIIQFLYKFCIFN